MKNIILIFCVLLFLIKNSFSSEKTVFLDFNYILINSDKGISISNELKSINKKNIAQFKKIEEKLKKEEEKIVSSKNVISEDEFKKNISVLKKKILELNKLKRKKSNEVINKRNMLNNELITTLNQIVAKFAKDNEISFVLRKNSIVIGISEYDITKIILKEINLIK
tara:strand:+ start:1356 stop:1856 length:501 start_codon:yes stop_codon:yes gene_type:complete